MQAPPADRWAAACPAGGSGGRGQGSKLRAIHRRPELAALNLSRTFNEEIYMSGQRLAPGLLGDGAVHRGPATERKKQTSLCSAHGPGCGQAPQDAVLSRSSRALLCPGQACALLPVPSLPPVLHLQHSRQQLNQQSKQACQHQAMQLCTIKLAALRGIVMKLPLYNGIGRWSNFFSSSSTHLAVPRAVCRGSRCRWGAHVGHWLASIAQGHQLHEHFGSKPLMK